MYLQKVKLLNLRVFYVKVWPQGIRLKNKHKDRTPACLSSLYFKVSNAGTQELTLILIL